MSDLDKVAALSVTVAVTVGLEPLMFPMGLIEVMVTPLVPPRLAPPLAPDLVLGLALPEVLCLLDLPTHAPFVTGRVANRVPVPRIARNPYLPNEPLRVEEHVQFHKSLVPGAEPHPRD